MKYLAYSYFIYTRIGSNQKEAESQMTNFELLTNFEGLKYARSTGLVKISLVARITSQRVQSCNTYWSNSFKIIIGINYYDFIQSDWNQFQQFNLQGVLQVMEVMEKSA